MTYTFKLNDMTGREMTQLMRRLMYFDTNNLFKCTFKKKVAYIHLDDDSKYIAAGRVLMRYKEKLTASKKAMDWFFSWYGN